MPRLSCLDHKQVCYQCFDRVTACTPRPGRETQCMGRFTHGVVMMVPGWLASRPCRQAGKGAQTSTSARQLMSLVLRSRGVILYTTPRAGPARTSGDNAEFRQ